MTDVKAVASECLTSWSRTDFDTTRQLLADDVTFVGPLGETKGADEYITGIKNVAKVVDHVDIHAVIAEGDQVCVVYDLVTKRGDVLPTVGWYEVRSDKVSCVRAFFDPRPMLAS